jgi:SAM-dependent methyltransferase
MLVGPTDYRDMWNRKPGLRAVYGDIYRRVLSQCVAGSILEIGGGSGNFKAFAPRTISTDIVFAPWLDLVCDAQQLPFADASFNNMVMVDVLHHVENPTLLLADAQRVLRRGGRLIFCEPAITPLSRIFYRLFHEEPFDMTANPLIDHPISLGRNPWESNQAIPTLLAGRYRNAAATRFPTLPLVSLDYFSFLAYPLSGGFKAWSALPTALADGLLTLEWKARGIFGRLAGFRLLAVYERA